MNNQFKSYLTGYSVVFNTLLHILRYDLRSIFKGEFELLVAGKTIKSTLKFIRMNNTDVVQYWWGRKSSWFIILALIMGVCSNNCLTDLQQLYI